MLPGENHAAGMIVLQRGSDPWRPLVRYEIQDEPIRSSWAVEGQWPVGPTAAAILVA